MTSSLKMSEDCFATPYPPQINGPTAGLSVCEGPVCPSMMVIWCFGPFIFNT